MIWLPTEDTSVVVLTPSPEPLAGAAPPDFAAKVVYATSDANDSLLSIGDGARLQIHEIAASAAQQPLAAVVPLTLEGFDRLSAVYRLLATIHGRAIPTDTRLTSQQRLRARRMVQAFDGHRDGATQQEIAHVVLRVHEKLDRDAWQASSARHAVKALLRDARKMVAGGYRRLLSHRRRA